jgi:hypothetical protein
MNFLPPTHARPIDNAADAASSSPRESRTQDSLAGLTL